MSPSRQRPGLQLPPADITGFPRTRLRSDRFVYRAHAVGRSPWWFSSDQSGRFDLFAPHGTCYLATDSATALRERFGHALVKQGVVTYAAASRTQVSALQVPQDCWLANTCSPKAATFSMTREIATCSSYRLPQAWAAALLATGRHAGVRYLARFSTGPQSLAIALFDEAGQRPWVEDPSPTPGVQACEDTGLDVQRPPTLRQVRIVQPPRRGR